MKRVLLLGMGPTALSALTSLVTEFTVVGVVRNPRQDSGGHDDVAGQAHLLGIPMLPDESLGQVEQLVTDLRPDCTIVSSYNRILGPSILRQCRFVNVHYAALPQYRGRANVNWAMINGELETAITIHSIAPGLDDGNVLYQRKVEIGRDDTVADLYAKLNQIQHSALAEVVGRHLAGYEGKPQLEEAATYGCTRLPADGRIDWSESTERIYAMVRALAEPYPPAYTYLGSRRLSVMSALPVRDAPMYAGRVPGRVVSASRCFSHVDVLTGDGVLRIREVAIGDDFRRVPASSAIVSTRETLGLDPEQLMARVDKLELQLARLAELRDHKP